MLSSRRHCSIRTFAFWWVFGARHGAEDRSLVLSRALCGVASSPSLGSVSRRRKALAWRTIQLEVGRLTLGDISCFWLPG